jgi:3-dehydroquinate dehydratase-2
MNGTNKLVRFLLLNGPNLNALGRREPEIYGSETLAQIVARVERRAAELDATLVAFQSNHEGALVDFIQEQAPGADGLIVNPGALGHYGLSLRDAIAGAGLPAVEVHISNVHAREAFRQQLVLSAVCRGMITGLGWRGYIYALESLVAAVKEGQS